MNKNIIVTILSLFMFCNLAHAEWVSVATHKNGSWGVGIEKNKKIANTAAMKLCEKYAESKCEIMVSKGDKGYHAVANSKSYTSWGFDPDSIELARQAALSRCVENTDQTDVCNVQWSGGSNIKASNTKTTLSKTTQKNVVTCKNQCSNGNCLRTFPNGRTERWQAPRIFNPISNNWEWDISTNACVS